MPYTYLVPNDTAMAQDAIGRCLNLSLLLARYVPREVVEKDDIPDPDRPGKFKGQYNSKWIVDTCKQLEPSKVKILQAAYYARWRDITKDTTRFLALAQGRVLVGFGGKGALETGLTLHYPTGLPVIPGSALKGLCRTYGLLTIAAALGVSILDLDQITKRKDVAERQRKPIPPTPLDRLDVILSLPAGDERNKALKEFNSDPDRGVTLTEAALERNDVQLFRAAFGSTADSGDCIFYDAVVSALPEGNRLLFEPDVMTPHFKQYYDSEGRQPPPPDDADNPIPLTFFTVARGTEFAFAVGARCGRSDQRVVSQAVAWLKQGLFELGIGAKTAAGYGVFQ